MEINPSYHAYNVPAAHNNQSPSYRLQSLGIQGGISIPIRHEWYENGGYCGASSLIATGMAQGQYMSQYTARELASSFSSGSQSNQILINDDSTDAALATQLGLTADLPSSSDTSNGAAMISWIQKEISAGHPVVLGVYENHSIFGSAAGTPDPQYDHIVTVTNIDGSNITFHDNGLYTPDGTTPQDTFTIPINKFLNDRTFNPPGSSNLDPNSPADNSPYPYSISNTGQCFAFAITGSVNSTPYPVSVTPDQSGEPDLVGNDPNNKYSPQTNLTPTVSNLTPGNYVLYEFRSPGGPGTPPPIFPSGDLPGDEKKYPVWNAPPQPAANFYGIIKYSFTVPANPPTSSMQLPPILINSSDTAIFRCIRAN